MIDFNRSRNENRAKSKTVAVEFNGINVMLVLDNPLLIRRDDTLLCEASGEGFWVTVERTGERSFAEVVR